MSTPVREGEILAGKYRVERVLGQGGMGVVVAARHVELDELVALKFLLPEVLATPDAAGRFLREARAAVRIKNEHVARVTDVGQLETGAPYMVMEYLDGKDLGVLLEERGPFPLDDAVDYVTQACEAMAQAHALGIVHRDLKPSNLMVVRLSDGSDCVKLLDFGISKVASPGAIDLMSMTRTLTVLGSPVYMSPEQMMSARDVDDRTDIWALGTILYELLTGRLPFVAENLPALGVLIATSEPLPMRATRPELPPGIDVVVARCLAKKREDRFADVARLAEALAEFAPPRSRVSTERASRILDSAGGPLTSSGSRSSPRITGMHPVSGSQRTQAAVGINGAATAYSFGKTAAGGTARRRRIAAAGGAALVMASTIAFLTLHRGPHRDPAAASRASPPPPAWVVVASATAAPPPVVAAQAPKPPTPEPSTAQPPKRVPAPRAAGIPGHHAPLVQAPPPVTASEKTPPAAEKKSAYDDM